MVKLVLLRGMGFVYRQLLALRKRQLFILLLLLLSISSLIYSLIFYTGFRQDPPRKRGKPVPVTYKCHSPNQNVIFDRPKWDPQPVLSMPRDNRILLFVETEYSWFGRQIRDSLDAVKFPYKVEVLGRSLPLLTSSNGGKYSLIIIESYYKYLNMNGWNRQLLDKYCLDYAVPIISYLQSRGATSQIREGKEDWLLFHALNNTYRPILYAYPPTNSSTVRKTGLRRLPAAIYDPGKVDGIKRVLFGYNFGHWLIKLLFVDSISFLTQGQMSLSLDRYLQIDIDDVFVGSRGLRMTKNDVIALSESQKRIQNEFVPGFRFHLGFSGKYYLAGDRIENEGDQAIIEYADEFNWFPHMWRHNKAHLWNESALEDIMIRNQIFAQRHGLVVNSSYAVAPHHSGVYPVHEPLYNAWKRVWNIRLTSTEEYPHQKPPSKRRGFIYRDTMFLVFMTHSVNFANDRLALYTFETELRFLRCWTNLKLKVMEPLEMGNAYFKTYPDERDAVWGNPCLDKKHLNIWSADKNCNQLPKAIILGPQKTGTTALYSFLKLHPGLESSEPSSRTFEEVQFFSGRNYRRGLDWYMDFFKTPQVTKLSDNQTGNEEQDMYYFYEKSANYFDSDLAPKRVKALIPNAKLIAILLSPTKRAYSWYQHQRAHNDPWALNYEFKEVLNANVANKEWSKKDSELWKLRQHCLVPGFYAKHLEKWLEHFSAKQILIIDGDELKKEPSDVMNHVQTFLGLQPTIDYSNLLKYDPKKGFFCQVREDKKGGGTKCLGKGKGRQYPPIGEETERELAEIFRPHNIQLHRLLSRLGYIIPRWLKTDLAIAL